MKKYLFSTVFTKNDLEKYKNALAGYLEDTYGLKNISEITEAQLMESYLNDVANGLSEFDRNFHYATDETILVMRQYEHGFSIVDVCENDIYNALKLCRGTTQEFYIENSDFKCNSTHSGELVIRFVSDNWKFYPDDFISNAELDVFTRPIGKWLNDRITFWNNQL